MSKRLTDKVRIDYLINTGTVESRPKLDLEIRHSRAMVSLKKIKLTDLLDRAFQRTLKPLASLLK